MASLMFVYGTRPEAIKLAPVIREAKRHFSTFVCVTGQHRELLDDVNCLFGIVPDHDLGLLTPNQTPADLLSRAIPPLFRVCRRVQPAAVVVQGDTTSTLAGALASFYAGYPVAHVEAGLRTHDLAAPFPEEAHRQLVTRLATWHFAPTATSLSNLEAEVPRGSIVVSGNTEIDAIKLVTRKTGDTRLSRRTVVVTVHRRESIGAAFDSICKAVRLLAAEYPDVDFVYILHPNPHFRQQASFNLEGLPNLALVEPLRFDRLISLLSTCTLVMTDSGGIQEDCAELQKPVLVLRDQTDRPESIGARSLIVGSDIAKIILGFRELIEHRPTLDPPSNPFGDGNASRRIVERLKADILHATMCMDGRSAASSVCLSHPQMQCRVDYSTQGTRFGSGSRIDSYCSLMPKMASGSNER